MIRVLNLRLVTVLFCLSAVVIPAQEDEYGYHILTPPPAEIVEPVPYLAARPAIDGVLDETLRALPARPFNLRAETGDTPSGLTATWRIAYGADFLWLYLESPGERLQYRDRAYQNGDGFHLVIAAPRPDNDPSDEFYVLACSAVDDPRLEWSRALFWYYNVVHIFRPVSAETRLATRAADGVIAFELLLPWKDVTPHHPWLSDGIGFNLTFVRAVGENDRVFFQVQSGEPGRENSPRTYSRLNFSAPTDTASRCFARLRTSTIGLDEVAVIDLAAWAPTAETKHVGWNLLAGEGTSLRRGSAPLALPAGFSRQEIDLPTESLPAGGYRVAWRSGADADPVGGGLTILPAFEPERVRRQLLAVQQHLSLASFETLEFRMSETEAARASLKPYETAAPLRLALDELARDLTVAASGADPYAGRAGYLRKAYRSTLDGTLQPYCVNIPANVDPARAYPLIVYLHGSASDETNLAGVLNLFPTGEYILLGPRGRGPSNCWSAEHAQEDIAEAIEAVCRSYPVDRERIILTGFSMGGYGVLRTHAQTPGRFAALAIFSGGPDIGPRWLGPGHPDFRDPANLATFREMPVFIFHGGQDRNVPFATTVKLVEDLRAAGAQVEFVTDPQRGHEQPGREQVIAFGDWLRRR